MHNNILTGEWLCLTCLVNDYIINYLLQFIRVNTGKVPFICFQCAGIHYGAHLCVNSMNIVKAIMDQIWEYIFFYCLRIYTRYLTDDNSWICSICEFSFTREITLILQLIPHIGEKIYIYLIFYIYCLTITINT